MEQIFTNATIVTPSEVILGTVAIENGLIRDIDAGNSFLPSAVDFETDLLIPGLVELHTDNVEKHLMPRPGVLWPVDAALIAHDRVIASAGITTVFDAVALGEVHDSTGRERILKSVSEGLDALAATGDFLADHRLHLRCEVSYGKLPEMFDSQIDHHLVGLVSVMDHTPGQRQFASLDAFSQYYQGKYGMSDREFRIFTENRLADQKKYSEKNRRYVVDSCQERGLSLASHDDASVAHVEEAIGDGVVVAEFPTTMEAAKASHKNNLSVLMGAPNIVRGKSHSGNVSARDLAMEGCLDIVSSDYIPSSLLHAALMLENLITDISLPRAINMVTQTPAQQAGFDDRGAIEVGLKADLVRVHVDKANPIIRDVWRGGKKIA